MHKKYIVRLTEEERADLETLIAAGTTPARTQTHARILLDLDGTDDPTHGTQEGSAYHAYYGQHMYHPLLIFDGDTDQLITAVLRPGTVHVSRGVVAILKRLLPVLKQRWPGVQIVVRADSGFATPALYDLCEQLEVEYSIGIAPNARLKRLGEPVLAEAREQQAEGMQEK